MPLMGKKGKSVVPTSVREGDYILIYWVDIVGSHSDSTDKAELAMCVTGGFFIGFKTSCGEESLVTADTHHPEGFDEKYEGSDIYPMSIIHKVEKLASLKDVKWPKYN